MVRARPHPKQMIYSFSMTFTIDPQALDLTRSSMQLESPQPNLRGLTYHLPSYQLF